MPSTYFYLASSSLLVTGYWGRTDLAESQRLPEARAADPDRARARGHVIDLTHLEGTNGDAHTQADTFRQVAIEYARTFGPLPTAVIVDSPHIFGLARIFQTVGSLQDPPLPILVVHKWDEAAAFLELDVTAAEVELRKRREERRN